MREKKERLIVTFHTTAGAMAMEKLCQRESIEGRLIPVPRCITSDCGMAWCAAPASRPVIEAALAGKDMDVAGFYEVLA